jgi:hypothetical protein
VFWRVVPLVFAGAGDGSELRRSLCCSDRAWTCGGTSADDMAFYLFAGSLALAVFEQRAEGRKEELN